MSNSCFHCSMFIFVMFVMIFDVVHGFSAKNSIDSPLLTQKIGANHTIQVNVNGGADFKTIQAAIDSVPQGNTNWIIIDVKKGVYREKVFIPRNKPNIFMRGEGRRKTTVLWSDNAVDNSATFNVEAPNFIVFGISFKNDAPKNIPGASESKTVAASVGGDMIAFYQCGFLGTHNTLFDYKGRHYYGDCYIQGSIDFIFGRAQSLFQSCEIFVTADRRVDIRGSITAQSRYSLKDNTGFVFVDGKVYGVGNVYLGRAKGAYSRVVFAKTYFSKTIAPQGWTNWSCPGSTDNMFQAEYKCQGPGSDAKARAPWSKQLNDMDAEPFLSIDFIQGKQWLPAWL